MSRTSFNTLGLSRRQLLALFGTGMTGLAGCSFMDDAEPGHSPTPDHALSTGTPSPTDTRSPTDTEADEQTTEDSEDTRPATPGEAAWQMFQADTANTGRHVESVGPGAGLEERWSYPTGVKTMVSRDANTVYAATRKGDLTALDIDDGTPRWTSSDNGYRHPPTVVGDELFVPWRHALRVLRPEDGEVQWESGPLDAPITSRISVLDGTLFWTIPGGVRAFDPRQKHPLWSHDSGTTIIGGIHPHRDTVYFGNDEKSGVLYALDPDDGSVRWTFTTNAPSPGIPSTPVATGDVVYVGNDGGWAHAVDTDTGEELWHSLVGGPVHTQPAIMGDRIVFGLRGFPMGYVNAYNRHSGERLWSVTFEGSEWDSAEVWSTPVLVDDTMIVGSDNGRLYGLDPSDGTVRWEVDTGHKIRSLGTVGDGVFLGNFGSQTFRVRKDGTTLWDYRGDGVPLRSPPIVGGGTVFVGGMDAKIHAVAEADGHRRWTRQTERPVSSGGVVDDEHLYFQATKIGSFDVGTGDVEWGFRPKSGGATAPVYADGVLYICETSGIVDHTVYAVDVADGSIRWEQRTESRLPASPVLGDGVLVSGSRAGTVYGFDAGSGAIRWRYPAEQGVVAGPTIGDGTVYVGDMSGRLHALDLRSGDHRWTHRVQGSISASPAFSAGTLYVATTTSLTALDVSSREERWQIPVGSAAAPAVDDAYVYVGDRTGVVRVVAAETGETVASFDTGDGEIRSAPAAVNGTVYVGGADGRLYALDAGADGS